MEIKEVRDKVLEVGNITSCAVMVIEKKGDILEYVITDPTKTIVSLTDLVELAGVMALRYDIVEYDKLLGGLIMTTDEFRDHLTISTAVKENILVVVIPNTADLNKVTDAVKNIVAIKLKNS